jgi:hypothetical protein
MLHAIIEFIKDEARALVGWTAAIGVVLIGFLLTEGASYHQLSVGLLLSAVSLFATMALLEGLWRAIEGAPRDGGGRHDKP